MKKKKVLGIALAATMALTVTMTGCSLVSTDNRKDMEQVVATVNITKSSSFAESEISGYADAVQTSKIIKRDLVAGFLNVGYSWIQNGYYSSYSDVFNVLIDTLVSNAVQTQYSVMYLLKMKAETESKTEAAIMAEYNEKSSDKAKYEYILGEDSKEVKIARYGVMSSLNSAIDSYELSYFDDDSSSAGTDTRTTPTGVDTEKDDYYPAVSADDDSLYYNVYTGYDGYLLEDSGTYQDDRDRVLKDNSDRYSRRRAYNKFISVLINNYLIDPKTEDLRDVWSLEYIQNEYVSQLESQIMAKYYDAFEEEIEEKLRSGDTSYLAEVYNQLLDSQSESYSDVETFGSAISDMSDTEFLLYAPDTEGEGTFGFVYNILLPFSAEQSATLTELQSTYANSEDDGLDYKLGYYIARNSLLSGITTQDQRAAWFNGTTDYSFEADEGYDYFGASGWLFFENNIKYTDRYETLENYDGRYAYNGTVAKADDDYILIGNKLDIDGMLGEFKNYINYVLGTTDSVSLSVNKDYYNVTEDDLLKDASATKNKEIDYSKFVYATGKVDFGTEASDKELDNRQNVLKIGSNQNKVLSAVNELQYAYTTDTGVLSQYLGYSVKIGDDTGYIKEFEYAAQKAIAEGAGAFAVCAGDYGWHLIYVTYAFSPEGGAQYNPDWSNYDVEGTFEYNFYEWIKSTNIGTISTTRSTYIVTRFNDDDTVVKYQSRYQDLLDLS